MGEKIVVGPLPKGLRNDVTPFNVDDDSFPVLINAYQWRDRVKRKRGTSTLGRLTRYFDSTSTSYNAGATFITLSGTGAGNIITGFSLQTDASIVPGSVTIFDIDSPGLFYTDPAADGNLVGNPSGTGTINYATGAVLIAVSLGHRITVTFKYYPDLPVMGFEDFVRDTNQFPGNIAFDKIYSYNVTTTNPSTNYSVSFYKNVNTATYPGYIQKTVWTPSTWNGQDYQQFWTTNYQGAMWTTNGINVPFSITNIGMQFSPSSTITYNSNTPTTINLTITNCPLVVGDFVFFNEWTAPTTSDSQTLNFQTGYVTACAPNTTPLSSKTVTITLPNAALAAVVFVPGIIQYLTTRIDVTLDSLRWYDGDPTNSSGTGFQIGKGWVNFAPPISRSNFSIADLPLAQYYLVGARMIVPFKDRLLFIGPVVQTSSAGSQVYLQDTVIYSQNGTPYYTASFTGDPSLATTQYTPILVPTNQTATASAYWSDQTGFGGFITAGIDQPIITSSSNEDVLILGFANTQTKFVYTGNDIIPFNFYIINSEYGSASTFSAINTDRAVITRGSRGYVATSQLESKRIDVLIPDEVFQINLGNNGNERFCSQRDFINEWIYFTYSVNIENQEVKFPNQTLQYNYRDNTWAIFNESYTTYGTFRESTGLTWGTVGQTYPTWGDWNVPWNAGSSTLLEPTVIGGNQQGFLLKRDEGTGEGTSLYIKSFANSVITSPAHGMNEGDYFIISGVMGTVATQVNGKIFSVSNPTTDTFTLEPLITGGTYIGGGVITRMYVPYIQSKQFPVSWGMGRKTRLGVQQYLLTTTNNSQITLLIFLSQNSADPYNDGPIFPNVNSENNSLIYSTVLYTCPESSNLGLTAANTNLQMITNPSTGASQQSQIWHRINTSLIGDSVQVGFTMSDTQMRAVDVSGNPISQFSEIEIHGFILDVTPSQMLS